MSRTPTGAVTGGTIVAVLVSIVVYAIVSVVVAMIFGLMYALFTLLRPGIIGFVGSIVGGVAGIYAARMSCDAILRHYSPKAVFVVIGILCASGLIFELTLPATLDRIAPIAQMAAVSFTAWTLFWKYDEI